MIDAGTPTNCVWLWECYCQDDSNLSHLSSFNSPFPPQTSDLRGNRAAHSEIKEFILTQPPAGSFSWKLRSWGFTLISTFFMLIYITFLGQIIIIFPHFINFITLWVCFLLLPRCAAGATKVSTGFCSGQNSLVYCSTLHYTHLWTHSCHFSEWHTFTISWS